MCRSTAASSLVEPSGQHPNQMSILRRFFETANRVDSEPRVSSIPAPAHSGSPGAEQRSVWLAAKHEALVAEVNAHDTAGQYGTSLAVIGQVLAAAPGDPTLLFARASTLFAWGRFREALDGYRQILALSFEHEKLFLRIAWSHYYTGDAGEAEAWMRRALAAADDPTDAQYGLAIVLMTQGKLDEAIGICEAALDSHPGNAHFLSCLGQCQMGKGNLAAAEVHFRLALAADETQAAGWNKLGVALDRQERLDEALEAFEHAERASAENREDSDCFVNVAVVLRRQGHTDSALRVLEANLPRRPAIAGHRAYADSLLVAGRFAEGWHHYEFRWLLEPLLSVRDGLARSAWEGQDLRGKTVLLRIEQGFGDAFQCLRYASHVKRLGATVLLGRFSEVARGFVGVDRIVDAAGPPAEIDYYIHLLSLPRVFGTELDSIPAEVPYLHVDPELVERWTSRIAADGALNVGLVWAGNPTHALDRQRSMPLCALMPVLAQEGVRVYGLQKGPAARDELSGSKLATLRRRSTSGRS